MAAAGLLAVVPSVSASGTKCNPGCEAQAEFRSRGEILIVHDYKRDHHSGVAILQFRVGNTWHDAGAFNGYFWNSSGFTAPPTRYNLAFAEGREVRYRACKGDRDGTHPNGGRVFDCSRYWRYDEA
jgi:hypothetical protein